MKKSKNKKEAKFFCESCGSEVGQNARFCPTCGKFFAAVRCPQCGRTGNNDDFKNGCPTCGYAVNPDTLGRGNSGNININNNSAKNNSLSFFRKRNNSRFNSRGRNSRNEPGSEKLPLWIYFVSLLVLIILVICLYSCL